MFFYRRHFQVFIIVYFFFNFLFNFIESLLFFCVLTYDRARIYFFYFLNHFLLKKIFVIKNWTIFTHFFYCLITLFYTLPYGLLYTLFTYICPGTFNIGNFSTIHSCNIGFSNFSKNCATCKSFSNFFRLYFFKYFLSSLLHLIYEFRSKITTI